MIAANFRAPGLRQTGYGRHANAVPIGASRVEDEGCPLQLLAPQACLNVKKYAQAFAREGGAAFHETETIRGVNIFG